MLNNKGFAVSTVLYTLLIAFLMFLGAALAQFSSSSSLIGKANDDLVNGTKFEVTQVRPVGEGVCGVNYNWYDKNTIVKIKSRYGTMYWPKDFVSETGYENGVLLDESIKNKNIEVTCFNGDGVEILGCRGMDLKNESIPSLITIPIDKDKNEIRFNYILSEQNDLDNLSISATLYDDIVEVINKIEKAENDFNEEEIFLEDTYGNLKVSSCVHFNNDGNFDSIDNYYKKVKCNNNNLYYDENYEEKSEEFINYLKNYADTKTYLSYDESNNILSLSGNIFGTPINMDFFPMMYVFKNNENINYEYNINSDKGEFDEIVYYDLVPITSNDGKFNFEGFGPIDQFALYNGNERVSDSFFYRGEFDIAEESMPKYIENYGKLIITDTISKKNEKLTLYDICK